MMAILSSYELWDTAIGDDKEPQPMKDSNGNIVSPANPKAIIEWKQRNTDTLCAIVISVQDNMLALV